MKKSILIFSLLLVRQLFSQIPNYMPNDSLAGYWSFNGNTNDLSVNANHGILNGALLCKDRFGNNNSAYAFTNANDSIFLPATNFNILSNDFTISLWFKSFFNSRMHLFNVNDGGTYTSNLNFDFNDNSGSWVFWNSGGAYAINTGNVGEFTNNFWHNLILKRKDSLITMYVDGNLIPETVYYSLPIGNNSGVTLSGAMFPWLGQMDEISLYNRALDSTEIADMYALSAPKIKIGSPLSTDAYPTISDAVIKWTTITSIDSVKIEYSLNNGVSWQLIADSIPASLQTYTWVTPNMPNAQCKIRITDMDNVTNYAYSDNFQISKYEWQNATNSAAFSIRDGSGGFVFQNKMHLVGGWNPLDPINYPNVTNNELWQSTDGNNWNLSGIAPFEERHTHGCLVYNNKMWIIGGDQLQGHFQTDVWNSADGVNWTLVEDSVPWGNRMTHMVCVFNNKMWVLGGQKIVGWGNIIDTVYNDVWSSTDGANWTLETSAAAWSPRGQINSAVVFNNRMWIIGGGTYNGDRKYFNDVWSSADGINWTLEVANAPWAKRQFHEVKVFDNAIWIIGGWDGNSNRKDVWYSKDGVNWIELKNTPWPERHASAVFDYNNSLWVVSGNMWNDSWRLNNKVCQSITSQPVDQTVNNGNAATFTVNFPEVNATYQWQAKYQSGWQNIGTTNFYNSPSSDTLKVNANTMFNAGQFYRCQVSSGACSLVSDSVQLNVITITNISEAIDDNVLSVYPNPATEYIIISGNKELLNSTYTITDQLGRVITSEKIETEKNKVYLGGLSQGIYFITISGKQSRTFKIIKE